MKNNTRIMMILLALILSACQLPFGGAATEEPGPQATGVIALYAPQGSYGSCPFVQDGGYSCFLPVTRRADGTDGPSNVTIVIPMDGIGNITTEGMDSLIQVDGPSAHQLRLPGSGLRIHFAKLPKSGDTVTVLAADVYNDVTVIMTATATPIPTATPLPTDTPIPSPTEPGAPTATLEATATPLILPSPTPNAEFPDKVSWDAAVANGTVRVFARMGVYDHIHRPSDGTPVEMFVIKSTGIAVLLVTKPAAIDKNAMLECFYYKPSVAERGTLPAFGSYLPVADGSMITACPVFPGG